MKETSDDEDRWWKGSSQSCHVLSRADCLSIISPIAVIGVAFNRRSSSSDQLWGFVTPDPVIVPTCTSAVTREAPDCAG
ncbi:hypothetical protein AAFF_G00268660 [Aldrovandia affinis]|uniref:Uncharacterized protein n=1 Tax=Aldrovandia affinis TaxID=143900 RepID=A0AAD7SS30_9TELE|nr:hypothetical protein AAFF_G00268660 [Aldrovandia affinis]